jgi:prolyl oligopeptidase PreP (S9A serine peptidase family)
MHKKISPQSKSFVILFVIAIVGTYACLVYTQHITLKGQYTNMVLPPSKLDYEVITYKGGSGQKISSPATTSPQTTTPTTTNTATWKVFQNAKYNFALKYPPNWQIKTLGVKGNYYIIEIRPAKTSQPSKIYINHVGFFALEGLPSTQENLGSDILLNIKDQLYGLKHNDIFLTFDLGPNIQSQEEFKSLVHSTTFSK